MARALKLMPTSRHATVRCGGEGAEEIVVTDIPIYEDEETREEFFTLADFLRAEQKRVARKHG
ncbi:MAG: hypothetical protein Q6373_013410, partial [Candidatus Sigynarchaeota archaeon]